MSPAVRPRTNPAATAAAGVPFIPRVGEVRTFKMDLQKQPGLRLGIDCVLQTSGCSDNLVVKNVCPGGIVDMWNKQSTEPLCVHPGDVIICVNGIEGNLFDLTSELLSGGDMRIKVQLAREVPNLWQRYPASVIQRRRELEGFVVPRAPPGPPPGPPPPTALIVEPEMFSQGVPLWAMAPGHNSSTGSSAPPLRLSVTPSRLTRSRPAAGEEDSETWATSVNARVPAQQSWQVGPAEAELMSFRTDILVSMLQLSDDELAYLMKRMLRERAPLCDLLLQATQELEVAMANEPIQQQDVDQRIHTPSVALHAMRLQ